MRLGKIQLVADLTIACYLFKPLQGGRSSTIPMSKYLTMNENTLPYVEGLVSDFSKALAMDGTTGIELTVIQSQNEISIEIKKCIECSTVGP
jgi:hypothetical protein